VIAHTTPRSRLWDETILMAMKERRVALIPTLTVWKYLLRHDRISAQEQSANSIGQLGPGLPPEGRFFSETISVLSNTIPVKSTP